MMTVKRKRELRAQLAGIAGNGGPEGALASILGEVLDEVGPSVHAEEVDKLSDDAKAGLAHKPPGA